MDIATLLAVPHSQIMGLTPDQWRELPKLLLALLSKELSTPLVITGAVYPTPGEVQPGVSLSFQSPAIGVPGLGIQIEGVMGLQSEPGRTAVAAWLFPFVAGTRARAEQRDFYEMELRLAAHGLEWHRRGWQKDIYGEFDGVKKWGDLAYQRGS